ncbi:alpha/beta hydrolase [Novosphingobium piscinae]|uniref:Alpha/beta hydrolase n=1 Tax=Novosphingobium piscinae TaxID=1507448 RepID=A0A7X1FVS2_9SPHN|nr:alpha/beta hydrolase fold domain-containing protein [Novosphingobium piscinae]MBC2667893.1 alpha/beta hydrolase [Novosphingobium piscinae]
MTTDFPAADLAHEAAPVPTPTITVWEGESLFSRLIRTVILPLIGSKQVLRDVDRHARQLARTRLKGETPPPARVSRRYKITEKTFAGAKALFVEPKRGTAKRTIIYIHGGAYVAHLMYHQWHLVEGLASWNDARVIVPHYPLAPEHDWRPAFAMMMALYESVLSEVGADQITLTGDSAGGGFALSFAQLLRDEGQPLPAKLVLFSPWLDLREDNPAQAALDCDDPMLARPVLVWSAQKWAGETPLDDPRISPVLGDIRGLPPTLVFSGTADLLHSDSLDLIARAQRANCAMRLVIGERMTHAWSVLTTREAKRLHAETAAFLR